MDKSGLSKINSGMITTRPSREFQEADPNHPAAPAQYQLSRLGTMKNFMLVDNWSDVKSKIVKGAVNIVRPPRELEGVIDELAQTDARRKAQPGEEAEIS